MTYTFLQEYWCFLVCFLGALLVFLMFVQGGQTLIFQLGRSEEQRRMLLLVTGRKWELTFTTLVTFGGAFFASFPLFYSTSFGGAYWVWMLILLCFVIQAVSYEFMHRHSNLLGKRTYRCFLFLNGVLGPVLIGTAVGTFFFGANFVVNKLNIASSVAPAAISSWTTPWHGLEAVADFRNVLLGLVVLMLSRCLAHLYFLNRVDDVEMRSRGLRMLPWEVSLFFVFFLTFAACWLSATGFVVSETTGSIVPMEMKFLNVLMDRPEILVMLLAGVGLVSVGLLLPLVRHGSRYGIWWAGTGTVLTVLAMLLSAGWGFGGVYYPSLADPQSSLTLANSCSSEFTLRVMSVVSLMIPFVLLYIIWAWRALEKKSIDSSDIA